MATSSDPLVGTLTSFALTAPHAAQLTLTAPWGASLPATDEPGLYIVTEGRAWLRTRDCAQATELLPGSVALLPRGSAHLLASSPDDRVRPIDEFFAEHGGSRGGDLEGAGGGGRAARLATFCFRVSSANARRLFDSMPELVVLPRSTSLAFTSHVAHALTEMLDSSRHDLSASVGLTETLLAVAFRDMLAGRRNEAETPDHSVSLARALIHAHLAHPWTVALLARKVGRSVSAFHDHFARATGHTPMEYVTHARMTHAQELLSRGDASVQEVAEAVGYQTASAFAVAFRRSCGLTPTEARRRSRR